jgi:uncharacterized protein
VRRARCRPGLIPRDKERSRALLERAAAKGIPEAQTVLGIEMLEGVGDLDSPSAARALLAKAASKGVARAHSHLGQSYLEHNLKHYDKALEHLAVAARAGLVDAQLMLGVAYYNGGGLYRSRAPSRPREGFNWIQRAAQGGHPLAVTWMGWIYQDGKAVPQDLSKAAAYWKRAAAMGEPQGTKELALAYRDGIGVKKDPRAYQHWLRKAARVGHEGAKEAIERQQILAEKQKGETLAALMLLGIAMGGGSSSGPQYMVPSSDPMQAWGMDIMMRIR